MISPLPSSSRRKQAGAVLHRGVGVPSRAAAVRGVEPAAAGAASPRLRGPHPGGRRGGRAPVRLCFSSFLTAISKDRIIWYSILHE